MGILRDFEKRLEGAVEGFFARVFRSGLQPVELAKAVQRYAQSYQQVGVDGVFVPNVYRFDLAAEDHDRFEGFADSLKAELSGVVKRTANDRGWRLQGPVRIELRPSEDQTVGTYELRGKIEAAVDAQNAPVSAAAGAPAPAAAGGQADEGTHTSLLPRPGAAASAHLIDRNGRRHPLRGTATIGRLPECEVTLDDASVSRRHARVEPNGDGWSITDLGSTNGVKVNGESVRSATLRDGDRLQLGSLALTFSSGG
jgi:hypothetical protein